MCEAAGAVIFSLFETQQFWRLAPRFRVRGGQAGCAGGRACRSAARWALRPASAPRPACSAFVSRATPRRSLSVAVQSLCVDTGVARSPLSACLPGPLNRRQGARVKTLAPPSGLRTGCGVAARGLRGRSRCVSQAPRGLARLPPAPAGRGDGWVRVATPKIGARSNAGAH